MLSAAQSSVPSQVYYLKRTGLVVYQCFKDVLQLLVRGARVDKIELSQLVVVRAADPRAHLMKQNSVLHIVVISKAIRNF